MPRTVLDVLEACEERVFRLTQVSCQAYSGMASMVHIEVGTFRAPWWPGTRPIINVARKHHNLSHRTEFASLAQGW